MQKSKLTQSFRAAFGGFFLLVRSERNLKIHLFVFVLTCLAGWLFSIKRSEWLAILLVSGLVISMEIINSSIEKLCDLVEPNFNEKVKIIKDTAAAAVLVAAAIALLIGIYIFLPYFLTQWKTS